MPGQQMPGMQAPTPQLQAGGNPIGQINAKLDKIMQKLGISEDGEVDKEDYLKKSPEEQDDIDAKQVLGKV